MEISDLSRSAAETREFDTGETIFQQGESGDVMYIVLEGEVDIRVNGTSIDRAAAGGIVGEMGLVDPGPRSASAVALQDSQLAVVGEEHFLFMVRQTPHFALRVMKIMAERLRKMNHIVC